MIKIFGVPRATLFPKKKLNSLLEALVRYGSFLAFLILLFHLGYSQSPQEEVVTSFLFNFSLLIIGLGYLLKAIFFEKNRHNPRVILELILSIFVIATVLLRWKILGNEFSESILSFSTHYHLINALVIILFFIELSKLSLKVNQLKLSPPLVFILSFLIVILIGTGLLTLPAATTNGISLIDAFFTATSAVCVTGLIVVDTAKDFTFFGQVVIMSLFQIGGLGMMTFTSFFGFFFKGNYSLENSLFLRDYINENNVSQVYSTLFKIILFTLIVEGTAAFLIFHYVPAENFSQPGEKLFFALFTAVSAFCNAGFATLTNGLYEEGFRDAYTIHWVIGFAIILGGIGFPVVMNYYGYIKHVIVGGTKSILNIQKYQHAPRVSSVNSRLVVYTTGILLVIGMVFYAVFEQNNTLQGLSTFGKITTTFFGAVTPRTAGFNTVDMTQLAAPTILIYLILMWIGASPGSTGGGLKTSTFAVALLNTISTARGEKRVEVFRRQISEDTLRKSFAVISLSILVIGVGIFLVSVFNPEFDLVLVTFEIISAFSTVGLSLGITGQLSTGSKIVVMVIMFLGRVGSLTFLIGLVRKSKELRYKYPEETVYIT